MLILGIETSCDETGVALYDAEHAQLLAHAVHSQSDMHQAYGGVVPELASRDHIRRIVPLARQLFERTGRSLDDLGAVAYTEGPGLAGALLVGASFAHGLAFALGVPAMGIHHLEGHLLSPLLSARSPQFPFVALLVSGGLTQLLRVDAVGRYALLGETQDDAAGEAFDKTAHLLGLPYPGGPALAALAKQGQPGALTLPRPMLDSGNLDFSFAGLKTAVALRARAASGGNDPSTLPQSRKADIAHAFQEAVVDVLVAKSLQALDRTGFRTLVVAGGVGANRMLRERLKATLEARGARAFFPAPEYCTDNGAMIAMAGALRLAHTEPSGPGFSVRPRWSLQ